MRKLAVHFVACVLVCVGSMAGPIRAETPAPQAVVSTFQDSLLSVWKEADTLSPEQRYDRLFPAVTTAFDLARMIRGATGSFWRKATDQQRSRLIEGFTNYSVATYTSRFKNYDGQAFEVIELKPVSEKSVTVDTQILHAGEQPVTLSYVMNNEHNGWKIVDVRYEYQGKVGNEVPRLHSEFRHTLETGGPDLLIEKLGELADKLMAE